METENLVQWGIVEKTKDRGHAVHNQDKEPKEKTKSLVLKHTKFELSI